MRYLAVFTGRWYRIVPRGEYFVVFEQGDYSFSELDGYDFESIEQAKKWIDRRALDQCHDLDERRAGCQ